MDMNEKCGCGKKVRYVHMDGEKEIGACNKYMRCPTYEELMEMYKSASRDYNELLYEVQKKFPGETRHQTALRYIKSAEQNQPYQSIDNN